MVNHSILSQQSLFNKNNVPVYRMVQQVSDTFNKLTQKDKVSCIEKYLKQLSTKWREEYEQQRKLNVPLIICRICSQNFYADKEKQHSQYCIEIINKTKALPLQNQKFLDLSNQLTECMLHIEKISQSNIPRLTPCQKKSQRNLFMTPTLQRRLPIQNMISESAQELVNPRLSSNSHQDKLFLPIVPEEQQVQKKTNFDLKLSDSIPNNKVLVAQQKLLSIVPRILNKVPETQQTKPQMNPLQMYTVRQPPIEQQQVKPQSKNISSTLNTLRGLEPSNSTQGPKLFSGGNEIKKQPSLVNPNKEIITEEQKITPQILEDIPSAKVIPPSVIETTISLNIDVPVLQKNVLELQGTLPKVQPKANQIRSILKMADATGIQIQPLVRKIEPIKNYIPSVNVKDRSPSPPMIKRSLIPNSQISKLTSSLRSLENIPVFKYDSVIQTMPNIMNSGDFLQNKPTKAVQIDIGVQEIIKVKEIPKIPKSEYIQKEYEQMFPDDLSDKQYKSQLSSQQRIADVSKDYKKKQLAIGHLNTSKIIPSSIEIKKVKEDALKNIEQLRKSVKLQKRASPFEKIISKLILTNENNFVEVKHQVINKQSSIIIPLLNSIDDLSKQDESQVIKSINKSLEEIKKDNCKNSPMDYHGVGGKSNNLQVSFEGMSPIITFRPLNRFRIGSDNSSTGTPILRKGSIAETGTPGSQDFSQWIDDNSSKDFTTLQSAKKELEILENLKTLALDIFNLASQLNQFKEKKIVLQRYKIQLEQMANADQNKYFSLGIKSLNILNQFISQINDHLRTIDDLDQLEKHLKMTLPWQKEPDLDDTSSRLSRQINISIQSKEAPVGSQIYKQGGLIFNQIYSPRLEPSRDLQNTKISPMKKLTQTPMLTSRELFLQGSNKKLTSDQIIAQKARSALLRFTMNQPRGSSDEMLPSIKEEDNFVMHKSTKQQVSQVANAIGFGNRARKKSFFSNKNIPVQQTKVETLSDENSFSSDNDDEKKDNNNSSLNSKFQCRQKNETALKPIKKSCFSKSMKLVENKCEDNPAVLRITDDQCKQIRIEKNHHQSDIVVGQNCFNDNTEDNERKTQSDIHEMFLVKELMSNQEKFNKLLKRVSLINEQIQNNNSDQSFAGPRSLSPDMDSEQSDYDEDVLTINRVRFSSLCILPSQIDQCCLNYTEKKRECNQISINDFILLKAISSGAFGKVILARKKNTDDYFAIKVLDKQKMVEKNVVEFVMNEKDILSSINNEYIVRGVYTFQSEKYLYMVMEFMKGGDFSSLLESIGAFDEDSAKYYIAQIVLALEYLHSSGVIHRDLKPENILIDAEGRIKLTDFGLSEIGLKVAKETVQHNDSKQMSNQNQQNIEMQEHLTKAKTIEETQKRIKNFNQTIENPQLQKKNNRVLGTCHYMAPEVINGEENTKALDLWSLGVIIYEFLTGALPFQADTAIDVFKKIKARDLKYPNVGRGNDDMSPEIHDLIERLLTVDPDKRICIDNVKKHPFFSGFLWDKISEIAPPFKPSGREKDLQYFPKAKEHDEELQQILNDKSNVAHKQFNKFDVVCYETLQNINSKEATKAMLKAERLRKRDNSKRNMMSAHFAFKNDLLNEAIMFEAQPSHIQEPLIQNDELTIKEPQ